MLLFIYFFGCLFLFTAMNNKEATVKVYTNLRATGSYQQTGLKTSRVKQKGLQICCGLTNMILFDLSCGTNAPRVNKAP